MACSTHKLSHIWVKIVYYKALMKQTTGSPVSKMYNYIYFILLKLIWSLYMASTMRARGGLL
jgi:hypothetical protein